MVTPVGRRPQRNQQRLRALLRQALGRHHMLPPHGADAKASAAKSADALRCESPQTTVMPGSVASLLRPDHERYRDAHHRPGNTPALLAGVGIQRVYLGATPVKNGFEPGVVGVFGQGPQSCSPLRHG